MVEDSRKTLCTETFKPVNTPEPVRVEEGPSGLPMAVKLGKMALVAAVEDTWRIDDEWWREEPLSRIYYKVVLASGQRLSVYKDLIKNCWYRQAC
jgi:hypothetical protein